jgi:hypothetical protein
MLHSLLQRNASRIQIPTATVTSNSSSEDWWRWLAYSEHVTILVTAHPRRVAYVKSGIRSF